MTRLVEEFKNVIKPKLMEKFNYKNIHQIPKISKIVLNMGIGEAKEDSKILDKAQEELTLISGQKAVKTKAKKAISNFKIREGMELGVSVTLRNKIMYEFLDRLINIAIPRIRDFRGLNPKSFDGNGNFSPIPLVQSGFFTPNDVKDMKSIRISTGEGQKQVILVANNNYLLQAIQFDPGSLKARKAQLSNLK